MVNINQSVAILCDGNNVERSIHTLTSDNVMINFDELIPKLLGDRSLNRFIYFREGRHISDKLADRLHEKFYGTVVPCHKSADIPLSIKATQLASKVDAIIIMSGDSDYVDLVKHLKSEGVRVEIAAVKANTASILLDEADYFYSITTKDVFRLPNNKKRPYPARNSNSRPNGSQGSRGSQKTQNSQGNHSHGTSKVSALASQKNVPRVSSQPIATIPLVNSASKIFSLLVKPVVKTSHSKNNDIKKDVKKAPVKKTTKKFVSKQTQTKKIVSKVQEKKTIPVQKPKSSPEKKKKSSIVSKLAKIISSK